mgnify:CR=1 FL=1
MPYRCASCAEVLDRWAPRCPACGLRGGILDGATWEDDAPSRSRFLEAIRVERQHYLRTAIPALDAMLGGGFAVGSTTLLGGRPGMGKSTLLLQAFAGIAVTAQRPVIYAACEEPDARIRLRAETRVTIPRRRVLMLHAPTLEELGREIEARPTLAAVAVDTISRLETEAPVGPRGRLVYCAHALTIWAPERKLAVLLLAHMNRRGTIAGSLTAEHLVDVVLHLSGRRGSARRILTADKNRYGGTDMAVEFTMGSRGLVDGRVLTSDTEEPRSPEQAP